jgi:hypothetical protein
MDTVNFVSLGYFTSATFFSKTIPFSKKKAVTYLCPSNDLPDCEFFLSSVGEKKGKKIFELTDKQQ